MYPIEIADGNDGACQIFGNMVNISYDFHGTSDWIS